MSKTFTFASVARPTWRYRLFANDSDNPAYDWRRSNYCLCSHLSQFDTMGHDEVQHSPDVLVQNDDVVDVVESLGCSLHKLPVLMEGDESGVEPLDRFWRSESSASDKVIRFAASLKFSETKVTYYSLTEDCKKSHQESKRHDKRWNKLERSSSSCPIDHVLTVICGSGKDNSWNCRPFGIIQHVGTVIRIAELIDKDCSQSLIIRNLQKSGVFESVDRNVLWQFLTTFERITTFKNSVRELRWARLASEHQAEIVSQNDATV